MVRCWHGSRSERGGRLLFPEFLPSWTTIFLAPFYANGLNIEPEEYLGILRAILAAGSDLALLMRNPDPSCLTIGSNYLCPGWDVLTGCLRSLRDCVVDHGDVLPANQLELTAGALIELAKAEKEGGRSIFPWGVINPQLREIYPAKLLAPLFSISEVIEGS